MKRIDKIASIACVVIEVMHWLVSVFMLVVTLLMLLTKDLMLSAFANQGDGLVARLTIDNVIVNVDQLGASGLYAAVLIVCLLGVVTSALMALVFRNVRSILKLSFGSTPFQPEVITRLRRVAVLVMVMPVMELVISLGGSLISAGQISANFDLTGLVMGVLVLCLVQVFTYGAQLQSDVDGLL